jgi:hypothetical protein
MGGPQVIVGQNRPSHEPSRVDPMLGWSAIRVLAVLFVLAGLLDIAIAFYPPRFSDKAWLFGVLSGVIGGLPVLSLGLCGSLVAAMTLKAPRTTTVLGILNGLLSVLIVGALIGYLLSIGEVRRTAPAATLPSISKNMVRTVLAGLLFLVLHATAFWVSRKDHMSGGHHS